MKNLNVDSCRRFAILAGGAVALAGLALVAGGGCALVKPAAAGAPKAAAGEARPAPVLDDWFAGAGSGRIGGEGSDESFAAAFPAASGDSAAASVASAVPAADASAAGAAHWLWWIFTTDTASSALAWLLSALLPMAAAWAYRRWAWLKDMDRVFQCVVAGARATWDAYVAAIKRSRADGKLTEDERREAVRQAIERAKQYAAAEGLDLAKHYAANYWPVLVDKAVKLLRRGEVPLA